MVVSIQGSARCDGRAEARIPLITDPAVCGLKLCVQWFAICGTTGYSIAVANALEFNLASN